MLSLNLKVSLTDSNSEAAISLVDEDHPQIVEAVAAAAEKAKNSVTEITQEMYMEALKAGIGAAEERRQNNSTGPRCISTSLLVHRN